MDVNRILSELDAEITRLQQIRTALSGVPAVAGDAAPRRRGRPKGSKNANSAATPVANSTVRKKRQLSPEGRKRIADAMKKRWADRRTSDK